MTVVTQTEENYLKAIFKNSEKSEGFVSTNEIASSMNTAAASVTDMIKRLAEKKLIRYAKYKGVKLTPEGREVATGLIRKHRLWEVFLVEKLHFDWDEVHDIAEQLEHIKSPILTDKLDEFLNFPKFDPHGDPIPDKDGQFSYRSQVLLREVNPGQYAIVVGVNDSDATFLQYLDSVQLTLGKKIRVETKHSFDNSMVLIIEKNREITVSRQVTENIFVKVI